MVLEDSNKECNSNFQKEYSLIQLLTALENLKKFFETTNMDFLNRIDSTINNQIFSNLKYSNYSLLRQDQNRCLSDYLNNKEELMENIDKHHQVNQMVLKQNQIASTEISCGIYQSDINNEKSLDEYTLDMNDFFPDYHSDIIVNESHSNTNVFMSDISVQEIEQKTRKQVESVLSNKFKRNQFFTVSDVRVKIHSRFKINSTAISNCLDQLWIEQKICRIIKDGTIQYRIKRKNMSVKKKGL